MLIGFTDNFNTSIYNVRNAIIIYNTLMFQSINSNVLSFSYENRQNKHGN